MQERFVDGQGGREHRRQRHGRPGAVSDAVGGIRDDAASPPGENRPNAESRHVAPRTVADTDDGHAGGHIAKRAAERDYRVGEGAAERQRRGQANVQIARNGDAAEENAPAERDRGQDRRLVVPVGGDGVVHAERDPVSAQHCLRFLAAARGSVVHRPLGEAVHRVGRRVCVHGGPHSPM